MRVLIVVLAVVIALGTVVAVVAGAFGVAAVVLPAARRYAAAGRLQTETQNIELGQAQAVEARFDMGCGTLWVHGGGSDLMEASFAYNVPAWKPEVVYAVTGGKGRLSVKQPSVTSVRGHAENRWDVRLSNGVPIDLTVHTGVGKSTLDLDGLDLTTLKVDAGCGDPAIRLGGSYPSLARIDLDSGVGTVALDLVGRYPALKNVDIDCGTGGVRVDLTGQWGRDAQVRLHTGVGKTSLRLPKDVGVRVEVDSGIGKVSGKGMKMDGKAFVNDAYGTSKVRLDVTAHSGTGDILLDLEK